MIDVMVVDSVATGGLTPAEGADLTKLIESFARSLELNDLAVRIAALEASAERKQP